MLVDNNLMDYLTQKGLTSGVVSAPFKDQYNR